MEVTQAPDKSSTVQETSFTVFNADGVDADGVSVSPPYTSTSNPLAVITLPPLSTLARYNDVSGFWNPRSFSEHFVLPPLSSADDADLSAEGQDESSSSKPPHSLLLTFDAMCPGDLLVCLSPSPSFVLGSCYAAVLGGVGNSTVVLRRRSAAQSTTTTVETSVPCSPCDASRWVSYWLRLSSGVLSVGVADVYDDDYAVLARSNQGEGHRPDNCVLQLDDTAYETSRRSDEAVRYVAFGNNNSNSSSSSNGKKTAQHQGGGAGAGGPTPLPAIRNITLRRLQPYDAVPVVRPPASGKFQLSSWEDLRGRGQGFITGIDMDDPEEVKRREARASRFRQAAGACAADDDDRAVAVAAGAGKRGRSDDRDDRDDERGNESDDSSADRTSSTCADTSSVVDALSPSRATGDDDDNDDDDEDVGHGRRRGGGRGDVGHYHHHGRGRRPSPGLRGVRLREILVEVEGRPKADDDDDDEAGNCRDRFYGRGGECSHPPPTLEASSLQFRPLSLPANVNGRHPFPLLGLRSVIRRVARRNVLQRLLRG